MYGSGVLVQVVERNPFLSEYPGARLPEGKVIVLPVLKPDRVKVRRVAIFEVQPAQAALATVAKRVPPSPPDMVTLKAALLKYRAKKPQSADEPRPYSYGNYDEDPWSPKHSTDLRQIFI
jgi:hypothetical protein